MTPAQLKNRLSHLYDGEHSERQRALAFANAIRYQLRTVQFYLSGDRKIPFIIGLALQALETEKETP